MTWESFAAERPFVFATESGLAGALDRLTGLAGQTGEAIGVVPIGSSRAGRPMWGIRLGRGEKRVSLTAGAHSDEPTGPATALLLAEWLMATDEGRALLETHRFHICPQVNPDGAARNAVWFSDPLDPVRYFAGVMRELPGDDVEFGYPKPGDPASALRPENAAVAEFLGEGGPYAFHASLHSMAFAEGAWFLIGKGWVERTTRLRRELADAARAAGMPLHDIERDGEKGFCRIEPGFCTTPTSAAMKEFFLGQGDEETASRFGLSSMEWVAGLGGDPLVMVSEMPLFVMAGAEGRPDPPGRDTAYSRLRAALAPARAQAVQGNTGPVEYLIRQHRLEAVPLETHTGLVGRMVLAGIRHATGCAAG